MKKLLITLLIFTFSLGFSQTNDELRTGAGKKKGSKTSSTSTSSSGSRVSAFDVINFIDLVYSLTRWGSKGIINAVKSNSKLVREKRDSIPRIINFEANFAYGAYPDDYSSYTPKIRFQGGILGTSARMFVRQDRADVFTADLLTMFDWQMLELNYLNRKNFTIRSGIGFVKYIAKDLKVSATEITTGADIIALNELLRINVEGRITPFGSLNFRRDVNAHVYLRPAIKNKLHFEVFGGGYFTKYFEQTNIWALEAGVGIMLY